MARVDVCSDMKLLPNEDLQNRLLIAIPKKGRLQESAESLLKRSGIKYRKRNRLDIAFSSSLSIAVVFLPAHDIALYVAQGRIDMGITGKDCVDEAGVQVDELLPLGFGKCKLCVQAPICSKVKSAEELVGKRIVTSFPHLARKYFESFPSGSTTQINTVSGSVEVACSLGLADGVEQDSNLKPGLRISRKNRKHMFAFRVCLGLHIIVMIAVDLVETGDTLRAAGLEVVSDIMSTQAVLIANPKSKFQEMIKLVKGRVEGIVNADRYVMVEYNIDRKLIPNALKITPGKRSATISPLQDPEGVAIKALILKEDQNRILDLLQGIEAEDILISCFQNCRV